MTLKVWLNNSMKKIDTSLHKPVIFLNGDKYRLDKAYTFVNGVKQQIWGEGGVQIDYIKSDGVLGGGIPFAVGETWLDCYYGSNVYRIDISNISNPILIRQVTYGNVISYNNFQSTSTDKIFAAWNSNTRTNYKLKMDNTTGEISVLSSGSLTATSSATNESEILGITNDYFIDLFSDLYSVRPTRLWNRYIYWNDIRKYDTSVMMPCYYFQDGANTFIGAVGSDVNRFSLTGKTDLGISDFPAVYYNSRNLSDFYPMQIFDDGTYCFSASYSSIHKRAISDLANDLAVYNVDDSTTTKIRLLGQIGNNIYCLIIPSAISYANPNSIIKLILLDSSNFDVIYEKILPNDPFDEYNGYPTFWMNSRSLPQISETGFIAFGMYDSSGLKLRITRFSDII